MKPICLKDRRFYRMKKAGVAFIEGMPKGVALPGNAQPEEWKPYKLWMGDLWECPDCGHQLISGVGQAPISEHYKPDFADNVRDFNATIQINDC